MERFALRMALCLIILTMCATVNAVCRWDLNKDVPKMDPLYFTKTKPRSLIIPGPNGIELQLNEEMKLICLGIRNYILIAPIAPFQQSAGLQNLTVQCVANNKLLYKGAQYDLNQFTCSSNSQSDVDFPRTSCSSGRGEIMELGFKTAKGFFSQVTVCYDRSNEASLYAVNTIYGKSIKQAEKRGDRSDFKTHGLTTPVKFSDHYTKFQEENRFIGLLGLAKFDKYINQMSFLSRGHLAPDADFLFGSWGSATYFYVNVVPQWQEINTRNWKRVENNARKVADSTQDDLTIFTGTYEVLKLRSELGHMEDIFLFDQKKLPVPMWMWKIVYSQKTQLGIAFVTLNNPYAKPQKTTPICPDICATSGWSIREFSDYYQGYTYCCNVNTLLAKVGTLSPLINVVGVLNAPLTLIG